MDLSSMYEKREKKKEQKEDFLTETIAFMCSISDEFKEFYLNDFLGLNISDFKKITLDTQEHSPGDEKNKKGSRPDMIIRDDGDIICVCEHKMESDIGEAGEDQLDKYYKRYNKDGQCQFKLILDRLYNYKNLENNTSCEKWYNNDKEPYYWQDLFIELKKRYNPDYFDYDDLDKINNEASEIIERFNRGMLSKSDFMLINHMLELLFDFDLGEFSLDDWTGGNHKKTFEDLRDAEENYFLFKKLLSLIKEHIYGKGRRGSSRIKIFVEDDGKIYTTFNKNSRKKDDLGGVGMYDWFEKGSVIRNLDSEERLNEELDFEEVINELKDKKVKSQSITDIEKKFSLSTEKFNKKYGETHQTLYSYNNFIENLLRKIRKQLKKKNIIVKNIKIDEDDDQIYHEIRFTSSNMPSMYLYPFEEGFELYFRIDEKFEKLKNKGDESENYLNYNYFSFTGLDDENKLIEEISRKIIQIYDEMKP